MRKRYKGPPMSHLASLTAGCATHVCRSMSCPPDGDLRSDEDSSASQAILRVVNDCLTMPWCARSKP